MLSIRKTIARQSSLQEKYVYLADIRPEGAKIIGSHEAFFFSWLFPKHHVVAFLVGRVEG